MKKILFFFLLFSKIVFSCECPPLKPVSEESREEYDLIFYGIVDSVAPCDSKGKGIVYFSISELYRGNSEKKVSIKFDCSSACLMSFAKNEEWLIYSNYEKFDLLRVTFCEHSRKKFKDDAQDIYMMASQRTFEDEKSFLTTNFGLRGFITDNELNKQQDEMGPHNTQPSGWSKLILLLTSLAVMGVVYYITRKNRK